MTRGCEIVYCFKCAVRLSGRDLESGAALRFADFYSCAACAKGVLESLSTRRKQALADRIEKAYSAAVAAGEIVPRKPPTRRWKNRRPTNSSPGTP